MNKSPGELPCSPATPSPRTRSCVPSSTPAGILMLSSFFIRTRPSPSHVGHAFLRELAVPLQVRQAVVVWNTPNGVRCVRTCAPVPLHALHRVRSPPCPLHSLQRSNLLSWSV